MAEKHPFASIEQYRIDDPERFRLAAFDPAGTGGIVLDRIEAKELLEPDLERLEDLQERLYADGRWALLIVLQGIDAAGKDGVIEHVMSGFNPQGCTVHSFKAPTGDELAQDFLRRAASRLPLRGHIGIFNRSHYEEVLAVRVHPQWLERQKLAAKLVTGNIWNERLEDIRGFERYLARNGIGVIKFFLHVSKEEQRRRLLARLDEPAKRWKFSVKDVEERKLWSRHMAAYEETVRATSRPHAPWFVVPADHKWFARLIVARAVREALEQLDPRFPRIAGAALRELQKVRSALAAPGSGEPRRRGPRPSRNSR
jgi:PPK2 family polyphosphate:nucleotide phosphotransferase